MRGRPAGTPERFCRKFKHDKTKPRGSYTQIGRNNKIEWICGICRRERRKSKNI